MCSRGNGRPSSSSGERPTTTNPAPRRSRVRRVLLVDVDRQLPVPRAWACPTSWRPPPCPRFAGSRKSAEIASPASPGTRSARPRLDEHPQLEPVVAQCLPDERPQRDDVRLGEEACVPGPSAPRAPPAASRSARARSRRSSSAGRSSSNAASRCSPHRALDEVVALLPRRARLAPRSAGPRSRRL